MVLGLTELKKRPEKRNRSDYEDEVIKYRERVEEERCRRKHSKIWHIDEAGLYDDATRERSYSPLGTSPQVCTPNSHKRDTIIITVCENGQKLPIFFVPHKKKKYITRSNKITGEKYRVLVDKGVSGLNNQIMNEWVTCFLNQPIVKPKLDILAFDNHRSHLNKDIMNRLVESGLKVLPFPKGAAADLSMLDNSLFRDYKRDFATFWEKEKEDQKEKVARRVWDEFPENRIQSYWRKCGYLTKPKRRRNIDDEKSKEKKKEMRTIEGTSPITSFFKKK
jgi:hypothetical protein